MMTHRMFGHLNRGRASIAWSAITAISIALAGCSAPTAAPKPTEPAKPAATTAPAAVPTAASAAPKPTAASAAPTTSGPAVSKLAQMTTLRYAGTGLSWSNAPHLVADAKKYFAEENITLEFVVGGQSAAVCQQLLAKAVEIGQCSLNDVIQIVETSGAPLVMVSAEIITALNYGIMAKPNIKTWADLKGKTIIVGGPKDNTVFYTRVMARPNGMKDEDYQFQYAGASSARFAALKAGAVDAAILTDPFDSQAEAEGFTRVSDLLPKYLKPENYAGGGAITTKDWAKTHPNEIVAYMRAIRKATAWIYDPANKDELFTIVQPRMNVSREAYDQTYRKTITENKMWSSDGRAIDSAMQGVIDSLIDIGSLTQPAPKASKYYDNSFVDLLNASPR